MVTWPVDEKRKPRSQMYTCGYCGNVVATDAGWRPAESHHPFRVYICPFCEQATFFNDQQQTPAPNFGNDVRHVPTMVGDLYNESRRCMSVAAYTAAVLASRKILMNIAVDQGAQTGLAFIKYIEYLAESGFIPPNGRHWVDHIRARGNEATHEIQAMSKEDAEQLITFVEGLLRFIYEFPNSIQSAESSLSKASATLSSSTSA